MKFIRRHFYGTWGYLDKRNDLYPTPRTLSIYRYCKLILTCLVLTCLDLSCLVLSWLAFPSLFGQIRGYPLQNLSAHLDFLFLCLVKCQQPYQQSRKERFGQSERSPNTHGQSNGQSERSTYTHRKSDGKSERHSHTYRQSTSDSERYPLTYRQSNGQSERCLHSLWQ